jgi:hypothetical protein
MKYSFQATAWKHKSPTGWHFVTLPTLLSKQIRARHGLDEEGWGRLKAIAKTGKSEWNTALWHDTHAGSYLLPIKSSVRKAEGIAINDHLRVMLLISTEPHLR